MDVSFDDEYTIFLDADDCALLQLGTLTVMTPQGSVVLSLGETKETIFFEESADQIAITISPTAYAVLLHMSFAVAEVNGKRIWLRMEENRITQREEMLT